MSGSLTDAAMFNGKPLPWVRDKVAVGAQSKLQAVYRDVVILDALNQRVTAYNLTNNNLGDPIKMAELRSLLVTQATLIDADHDALPDQWETQHFGNRSATAETLTRSGLSTLVCFATGLSPNSTTNTSPLALELGTAENTSRVSFFQRQRLGKVLGIQTQTRFSSDLQTWSDLLPAGAVLTRQNPYDGTGTEIITVTSPREERRFVKLHVTAPQ